MTAKPSEEVMSEKGVGWGNWYRTLKAVDRDAYDKAIRYAEGVSLSFDIPLKAGAEIERAMVMLACELLEIHP